jgi:acyl-CoA thioester hydrolase
LGASEALIVPNDIDAALSDPRVLWTEDILRFADTDALGHINNTTFSVLCESGRVHLLASRINPTLPAGVFFVIARLAIDFLAELHYPGAARTGTWITRIGRSSLAVAQIILSGGQLAATSEAVCVLMDSTTRRPAPLSDQARRAAEALLRAPEA